MKNWEVVEAWRGTSHVQVDIRKIRSSPIGFARRLTAGRAIVQVNQIDLVGLHQFTNLDRFHLNREVCSSAVSNAHARFCFLECEATTGDNSPSKIFPIGQSATSYAPIKM